MHLLWMVLGTLVFASMAVCVKFASSHFNAAELVFYRGIVSMVLLGILARRQHVDLRTRHPFMHAWRSLVGVGSMGAWFYAIGALPIATATTLNYMSSIWVGLFVVLSSLLQRSSNPLPASPRQGLLQAALIVTILTGFAGVVLMLRPSLDSSQSLVAALVGVFSGMGAALAYMQVVGLARIGEPETRVVFYFAVGSTVAGGLLMPVAGISTLLHPASLWLLPMGLLASLGQLCMTHAYSTAASPRNTLVVASLQYSGIVFAGLYGLLLFDDSLPLLGWLGMALIIASGVVATLLRAR
ncbi:EamA-like transporter family protein [Lampropedia hyalina DSM 16112]|jgi:drug/metabolite transporter (DMT)-like permease|uniref:EamA-like transporter family protein n=1 Tax=Lampropedia hyalina DSM 16112 TaxID=1122156 RepID=A0A1M5DH54_9BURK|nr:DMT family transporter [Lampropedia hyalina]SHF66318.1 EamA-like transporter family protein [Lampropedia hyalina DSM 16112]